MTEEAVEDERDIELSSLQAIYPELEIQDGNTLKACLDIEVHPSQKLAVSFAAPPAIPIHTLPTPPSSDGDEPGIIKGPDLGVPDDTRELEYLPSLRLQISLPPDYPEHTPPEVALRTEPAWLPEKALQQLVTACERLWEEYGRSQVLFAYLDYLQQEAEQAFHPHTDKLVLPHTFKTPLLDFSHSQDRTKFHKETFDCGVCLEPKKGSSCHRLRDCGHVFCIGCLQDFYDSAITEGDVGNVKCLAPDCGKGGNRRRKQRTLHPRELLEVPIERPKIQRYIDLKLKKKLDSDKTTVFCPRKFCQAPARSPKYAKYINATLENYPESDSDGEDDPAPPPMPVPEAAPAPPPPPPHRPDTDRLRICSSCSYAFCLICHKSWHGDLQHCRPPNSTDPGSLTAEEAASLDYIKMNTSPCPTCSSPAQKTHGCNHMICYTCGTHFCYLCSAWLHAGNPYQHFNTRTSSCYMRLWELEEGDEGAREGGDANAVFGGVRAAEQAAIFAAMVQEQEAERLQPPAHEQPEHAPAPGPRAVQIPPPAPQPPQQPRVRAAPNVPGVVQQRRYPDPGLQRFLQLAANDQEDDWDSDEMEDLEGWGVGRVDHDRQLL